MLVCFGSLFLVVIGLLGIFAKDMMWDLTAWQNQMKGLASERTDTWDTMTTIGGVVAIIFGVLGVYMFFANGL
ncbi:MAG: hypothetical protein DPW18_10725 [Chloroflexi bacterium]|nr:MAG: hypothetical protein EDM79_18015 [Chloroflexota bacterium]MCQ3937506.1 hypothetical protein [Chloroflexota bacterium]MDL1944151.1 hypothetical protein [Chloroflexi bacterium CFX2]